MRAALTIVVPFLLPAACAISPAGEDDERARSDAAGTAYAKPYGERQLPPLSAPATLEECVARAMAGNGDLEQAWFEWRAALERVPQEGSQATTLEIGAGFEWPGGGRSTFDRTTLTAGTDSTAMLEWPGKVADRARAAFLAARAAGYHYLQLRDELRARVVAAYLEFATLREEIAVRGAQAQLLAVAAALAEQRVASGAAAQAELLRLRTELDLARDAEASSRSREPGLRARLLALLGVDPTTPLDVVVPEPRPFPYSDAQVFAHFREHNPELAEHALEVEAAQARLDVARQAWIPELSLSFDLVGSVSRMVAAGAALPFLRRDALRGLVREAEADLAALQAYRRQMGSTMAAGVVLELAALRNAERQVELFAARLVPRAVQAAALARSTYANGRGAFTDWLDAQRVALDVQLTLVRARSERERSVAELERYAAHALGHAEPRPPQR